jgi:hypothetical protein
MTEESTSAEADRDLRAQIETRNRQKVTEVPSRAVQVNVEQSGKLLYW